MQCVTLEKSLAWHKWDTGPVTFIGFATPWSPASLASLLLHSPDRHSVGPVSVQALVVPETVTWKQITDSGVPLSFLFSGTWWSLVKPALS